MRFKIFCSLFVLSFLFILSSLTVGCTGGSTSGELVFDSLRTDTVIQFADQSEKPAISIQMKFDYARSGLPEAVSAFNNSIVRLTPALTEGEVPFAADEDNILRMMQTLVGVLSGNYRSEVAEAFSNYDNPEEIPWLNYEADYEGSVLATVGPFLSYQIMAYFYTGGAHGSTLCNYLVFDTSKNSVVQLGDIVDEQTRPYIAELMANKPLEDMDGRSLNQMKKEGYLFEDAVLDLPDNFFFTSKGITFVFQQYEIAPYAMGLISVTLTWDELQPLLPEDSVALTLTQTEQAS